MIVLDICLSDIPANKRRNANNGKVYTSIVVDKRKEVDDKGNTHTVYMNQTKEERTAKEKKAYIGNAKEIIFDNSQSNNPRAGITPSDNYRDELGF